MIDALERDLINQFQGGFPLEEQPFETMAVELGCDEAILIQTIQRLLEEGWLSRFGPLFDAQRMGGGLTLAAMSVPETRFHEVSSQVNAFPEVAHNYRRDHELNMWFVLATATPEAVLQVIQSIEEKTGLAVYNFPKLQEFYLGLWLQLEQDGSIHTRPVQASGKIEVTELDAFDRSIITATQEGLPLVTEPYGEIAVRTGSDTVTVIARLEAMIRNGVIRRIGLVPNHYKLGLRGNGMSVWDVPDDQLEELGKKIGALDFVSHCYERPRHLPQWSYNLFAMVHGHDREEVKEKVSQIAELMKDQCQQHDVLFSSAILKKTGLRLVA